MNSPVLLLVFNRPEKTKIIFDLISNIKPEKLYVAIDGPRNHVPGDIDKCEKVLEIVKNVDWNCESFYLIRDVNLGCSKAIVSAIDWFFEQEEEGIILEDDCLPNISFFNFCNLLLSKYRDNEFVMMISGSNLGETQGDSSYYFTKYGQIWGWATWKRAWNSFERVVSIDDLDSFFTSKKEKKFWKKNFKTIVWDVQWAIYSIWKKNGISILPNSNLVTNIGFDLEATNYKDAENINSNLVAVEIGFPLTHPQQILTDKDFDTKFFIKHYTHSFTKKILQKIKFVLK